MKSRILTCFTAIALFAALSVPVQTAAQNSDKHHPKHHHYQLIDMGTFGGPLSGVNEPLNYVPTINGRGDTVGFSSNGILDSSTSNPTACFGANVSHGFVWDGNTATDLGGLGGTGFCSDADSINASGQIEGVSENGLVDPALGLNEIRAVVWDGGHITDLGTLGGNHSWSFGINNQGQVVGMALNAAPDPFSIYDFVIFGISSGTQTRAFLWDEKSGMRDLGTLGGPDAWAWSINEHGQIAGLSYTNSTPNPASGFPTLDPFLVDNGKMHDLGSLGGVVGFVGALNNRGEVIGGSSTAANPGACYVPSNQSLEFGDPNCHPFLWNHGTLIDLNTSTSGGSPQTSDGMNDIGEIVGAAAFPTQAYDAYLWRNGVATDLGHLSGDCYSEAWAVNRNSQVVGDSFSCDQTFQDDAFLWEGGSIVNLNTLTPKGSSLQLVFGNAINDHGEIAGIGVPAGCTPDNYGLCGHAYVLIPCDEYHPGIEGCDYSMVDVSAAPFSAPAPSEASGRMPARAALWRHNNRFHFPAIRPHD